MRTRWGQVLGLGLAVVASHPCAAQLLSGLFPDGVPGYGVAPGVTVLSRARPDVQPLGVRAGAINLYPQLEQSVGFDSNVLGGSAARHSWVVRTQPSLLFGSTWSRDAIGGYVSLSDVRYANMASQDRTDGTISLGGSLDIGRDRLTLAAAHVTQHQDNFQPGAVLAEQPIALTLDDARTSYAASFGRWTVTPNIEAMRWQFGSAQIMGGTVSQAYRDRTVVLGGTTLRYEVASLRNLVFVARALSQDYRQPLPGQARLDSTGYQVLGGVDYDDDALWRYRVLVGGESRQFAAFRSHNAVIAEAEAAWTPTGMTTLKGTATRSVEDAGQEGVAGFTYTAGRLTLDHEYLRNVVLSAAVGLQRAEFLNGGGTQTLAGGGLGLAWWVNRHARLSANYDLNAVRGARAAGSVGAGDYQRHLALLSLRLGL